MLDHKGTVTLKTDRLILRRFEKSDAQDMYRNWASDGEVTKFLSWPVHGDVQVTEGIVNTWVSRYDDPENYHWAICLKENNEVIGSISLADVSNNIGGCEAGYCIGRAWWNKGYMTEAFSEVIRFAMEEVGFIRVGAKHDIKNDASGCVMKHCGLQYEGTLRKIFKNSRGDIVDCKLYSIISDEYYAVKNKTRSV